MGKVYELVSGGYIVTIKKKMLGNIQCKEQIFFIHSAGNTI
jgi:hypothetical protein